MSDAPDSGAIVSALLTRDWYAIAALLVWTSVYAARRLGWLERIPEGWRWAVPVALGAAGAFVSAWSSGAPWADALSAAAQDGIAVALLAMGAHGALKDSPLPYGGTPQPPTETPSQRPGAGPGGASVTGLLLVALLALGCAKTFEPACTPADLANLQAVYADELLRECGSFDSLSGCPKYPELRDAHNARVQAWVECSP